MHLRSRGRLLFPCKATWQRKTQCLQTPIPRASIAPAITSFCRAGHNREVILVFQFSSGLIDAQGWLRQCEANPGRFRLRFFSQKPEQGKIGAENYSGD
jgi:hypothetical protein